MKTAKTVEEQISILRGRNMLISNESKAKESLLDIGYYRLGFYAFPFEKSFPEIKHRNHQYIDGTIFSDVVELYYFDMDLRNILTYYLTRVEVSVRTYITYEVSNLYKSNPYWFSDTNLVSSDYVKSFSRIYPEIRKNAVIHRHHKKYPKDKYAPAWKTLEFMTFGNIQKLYENIIDKNLRSKIAARFGCKNEDVFKNYMETLRILRNACAHGACIYNINLPKGIKAGPAGKFSESNRHNIVGIIEVLLYVINSISTNRRNDLSKKISDLLTAPRSAVLDAIISKSSGFNIKR